MSKPAIISQIEDILNQELFIAPIRGENLLDGLMPYSRKGPKYAMDGETLIGLNLAKTDLTDSQWGKIISLPDFKKQDIRGLSLSENQLTEFRLEAGMTKLERLYVDENPLTFPDEAIVKQGNDAVLRFLKDILSQGEEDVYEVKMLILGEGETGKTTLWHKLQDIDYPVPQTLEEQPSTVGVEIMEGWTFDHLNHPGTPFRVNLWDFGGQPIQQMTHQFFLTRRSFYVLLADSRRDVANFAYWFKIINLLGCDPKAEEPLPVLVVLNKKGTSNPPLPYDPEDTKNDFPNLKLINYEVDFAITDFDLKNLPKKIQDILCNGLPHLPLKIPALWNDVRNELYSIRRTKDQPNGLDHIKLSDFQEICKTHGIKDEQQMKDLSQLLHDLGVILHHQDDGRLRNFIILNPEWALNAVYEILRYEEVGKNQGRFDEQLLTRVWDKAGYTPDEQINLMNLMLKDSFEVCFRAEENRQIIYIAPQLLPQNRPSFEWNAGSQALRYTFQYPFMPKGLIGRLIVRLNEGLKSKDGKKLVWLKGMLLSQDGCDALVVETKDERGGQIIQIEINGPRPEDCRFLLRTIRMELDRIHKRSFPSLKFYEKIPCCCDDCRDSKAPEFYELDELQRRESKGKLTIECKRSFEDVSVDALMYGVYGQERPRKSAHSIKDKISKGELEPALKELAEMISPEKKNLVLNLLSRLSELEEQINQGVIMSGSADEKKERNSIRIATLDLCDEIR